MFKTSYDLGDVGLFLQFLLMLCDVLISCSRLMDLLIYFVGGRGNFPIISKK